jgi:hypothetical protein
MSPQNRIIFTVLGGLWVGGWGFAFYRYPEFFASINQRLGRKMFATPRYIALLKGIGIVEMVLAGIGIISLFLITW